MSIENSEKLSRLLDKRGIKHETLNAKNHEREAHIIAQAGRLGAVTIATNMAGRGTDILLGGNPTSSPRTPCASAGSTPTAARRTRRGGARPHPPAPTAPTRLTAPAKRATRSRTRS